MYEITLGNASSLEIQLNEYRLQPSVAIDSDCVHWSLEEPLHWWEPGLLSLVWANMVAGAIAVPLSITTAGIKMATVSQSSCPVQLLRPGHVAF